MELVGDYSKYPVEGMCNDIPMLSLSRAIEEMLRKKDIPKAIEAKKGVLM